MHRNLKDMLHNRGVLRAFLIVFLFSSAFFLSEEARAQSVLGVSPVNFVVTPDAPTPGAPVTIQVRGVGDFLGESNITWRLNGGVAKSGIGERSFTFTAGGLGVKSTVSVTIESRTEGTITKTFTFNPSIVNMLWEADTSIPPWFKGKALYTAGSNIRVLALPQIVEGGKTVAASTLTFKWSRNGTPLTSQSGRGFVQVNFAGDQLKTQEVVSVEVYSGTTLVAKGSVTIPASNALVVFYEQDPLRGMLYDRAVLGSYPLSKDEITLQAQPFYFSAASTKDGSLTYNWTLNNQAITGPDSARGILTLRQSGAGAGSATVGVELQNTDESKFLQSAQTVVKMLFGGATQNSFGSFFGL
ncbi:MAG TPA: hypothetical protein VHL10_04790 [Nitrososphaera sp.]|nr:hypothetical protein [Nitrososphaera sp.]